MSSPKKSPGKKGKKKGQELNADGTKKKVEPKYVPMECVISAGIHPSSSESWGADACAKIFSHVLEANDGRAQMIVENKTEFLSLYTKEELEKPDDIGNTLSFLAVYHDRPEMLRYLYTRGLDLSAMCDPVKFGNPMFYAVCWRKYRCVDMLDLLGVSVKSECDMLKQTPLDHAKRTDDYEMIKLIDSVKDRGLRVAKLFYNNYLRAKARRWYQLVRKSICTIQRLMRGKLGRKRAKKKRIKKKKLEAKKKAKEAPVVIKLDEEEPGEGAEKKEGEAAPPP